MSDDYLKDLSTPSGKWESEEHGEKKIDISSEWTSNDKNKSFRAI